MPRDQALHSSNTFDVTGPETLIQMRVYVGSCDLFPCKLAKVKTCLYIYY
jgi:hypothetical protein